MQSSFRTAILPLFATALTVLGISYSACQDSNAEGQNGSPAKALREEIVHYEQELNDLKKIHQDHIKAYSYEMGCNGQSQALEVINNHNQLIDHLNQRLQYHKLQLIQSDTSNIARNSKQLEELKKDEEELTRGGNDIRTGLNDITPTHVTK
jgi:hypothetical protein